LIFLLGGKGMKERYEMKEGITPPEVALSQMEAEWDVKQKAKAENTQYVIITEIDIPFTKLIGFLVRLAIAAVPAGIIVFILWRILASFLVIIMK
jgi:hypothetical protein